MLSAISQTQTSIACKNRVFPLIGGIKQTQMDERRKTIKKDSMRAESGHREGDRRRNKNVLYCMKMSHWDLVFYKIKGTNKNIFKNNKL